MTWILFLLIGFGVGYVVGRRASGATGDPRREAVMQLFAMREEITNDDVQKAISVSDATATRYLDTLEKSGDIVQVGATGSAVIYRKK